MAWGNLMPSGRDRALMQNDGGGPTWWLAAYSGLMTRADPGGRDARRRCGPLLGSIDDHEPTRTGMGVLVARAGGPVPVPHGGRLGHLQPPPGGARRAGPCHQGGVGLVRRARRARHPARHRAAHLPPPGVLEPRRPLLRLQVRHRPGRVPAPAAGQPSGHRRGHAVRRLSPVLLRAGGLAVRLFPHTFGIYLMRLLSALFCAAFLAASASRPCNRRCARAWPWPASWWP